MTDRRLSMLHAASPPRGPAAGGADRPQERAAAEPRNRFVTRAQHVQPSDVRGRSSPPRRRFRSRARDGRRCVCFRWRTDDPHQRRVAAADRHVVDGSGSSGRVGVVQRASIATGPLASPSNARRPLRPRRRRLAPPRRAADARLAASRHQSPERRGSIPPSRGVLRLRPSLRGRVCVVRGVAAAGRYLHQQRRDLGNGRC